jgi:Uma2 family endonuclease
MDAYMPMSTTRRHNKIINEFVRKIAGVDSFDEVDILTSECALAHWGSKRKSDEICRLVDITLLENIEYFTKSTVNYLEYVQPDFVLFRSNPFIVNEFETITAGCPDLIVEIWSESNSKLEKEFKLNLYSSSDKTEHWYMEQGSNKVTCFIGKETLPTQSLLNILRTNDGIEFDLRKMAIR